MAPKPFLCCFFLFVPSLLLSSGAISRFSSQSRYLMEKQDWYAQFESIAIAHESGTLAPIGPFPSRPPTSPRLSLPPGYGQPIAASTNTFVSSNTGGWNTTRPFVSAARRAISFLRTAARQFFSFLSLASNFLSDHSRFPEIYSITRFLYINFHQIHMSEMNWTR